MTEIKEAKTPAVKTNTAVAEKKRPQTIKDYITVMKPEIAKALPSTITPERFTRIALSAVSNSPELASCNPKSFLASLMNSAQLGLEPNSPLGMAYILPFRNHGTMECQYIIGYLGYIELAHRAGTSVTAETVYENDEFEYELGLNPKLVHKPAMKDRGEPIAYYATWKNADMKAEGFTVMSKEDIENHAKRYSKSYNSSFSPWRTSFESMAKKTVLKQALKYAPLASEIRTQLSQDESVKSEISSDMSLVANEMDFMDADYQEVSGESAEEKSEGNV